MKKRELELLLYLLMIMKNEKPEFVHPDKFSFDSDCYPIFKSTKGEEVSTEYEQKIHHERPYINEETLSVYLGNEKLYMLPLWKCKQTNNIVYKGNNEIYNFLFKNYNLPNTGAKPAPNAPAIPNSPAVVLPR